MRRRSLFCILFSLWGSLEAHGEWSYHRDDKGVLRCISHSQRYWEGYLLVWNESKQYQRDVFALPLRSTDYKKSCFSWPTLLSSLAKNAEDAPREAILLAQGSQVKKSWGALEFLPQAEKEILADVALGANEPLPSLEEREKILSQEFTKEWNRSLSARYGMQYAADIFRTYLERKAENKKLQESLLAAIPQTLDLSRYKNTLFLVASGYLEPPEESRVKAYLEDLAAMGLAARKFQVDSTASVETNAEAMAREILQETARGKEVILAGASKGGPEILAALALARKQLELGRWLYPGYGRVLGVLSLSGTIRGSFLVDWASGPIYPVIIYLIEEEAKKTGIPIGKVWPGFYSQSSKYLKSYLAPLATQLPNNIPYWEVVGIPQLSKLPEDSFVRSLQEDLLDTRWFPKHASNDGFLEYPAMLMPKEWGVKTKQILFSGSHMIYDGDYYGHSMLDLNTRKKVVGAMLQEFAKEFPSD